MPKNASTALLGGLDPAAFLRRHWQKRALLVRQALPDFRGQLFRVITQRQSLRGKSGVLLGVPGNALPADGDVLPSHLVVAEQSNSSMLFENKYFLKLYRKLEDGMNPDVEITRFLTEGRGFVPRHFEENLNHLE